jgi:hypothetical protein
LTDLAQLWWGMRFRIEFLERKGAEFQTLFTRIMELRHPGDFTQVRPWGNIGDLKCDGWLASEKRLFQVYAPNELSQAQTDKKMDEDFKGALLHWGGKFDHWTFVHNSREGFPPFVLQKTQAFEESHPTIGFVPWGYANLRQKMFELDALALADIFGAAPSAASMQSVRFAEIEKVLQHLQVTEPPAGADLRPVPKDKLAANALSNDVADFLRLGMRKAPVVADFFKRHHDPRYGDALAYQFIQRYLDLKRAGKDPDAIFWELRGYAGANDSKSDREESAALAVLAHFFEECDIFERPGQMEGTNRDPAD